VSYGVAADAGESADLPGRLSLEVLGPGWVDVVVPVQGAEPAGVGWALAGLLRLSGTGHLVVDGVGELAQVGDDHVGCG